MKLLITTQMVDKNDPILGFFHGWILEFAKYFNEVHIICLKKGVYDLPPNVFVYSLGKESGENRLKYIYRFYKNFWKIFFDTRVDFVFFHMGAIYNILAAPFFFIRKLYATKFYWWKTHGVVNLLGRTALFFTDDVFTAGSKSFPIQTNKLHVVGHAIDTNRFTLGDTTKQKTPPLAVVVGRITPIKKIEVAIDCISILKQEKVPLTLQIIGTDTSETYRKGLETQCRDRNLTSEVQFVGSFTQEQLGAKYHEATFILHPAFQAGFDKVVLEAMACGVIPLTSIPSFEPVLSPLSLFVKAEDATGYAMQIGALLRDEERSTAMRQQLREIVVRDHSLATLTKRIFKLSNPIV